MPGPAMNMVLRFVFDYVDPGSYLASRVLHRWLRDTGVMVEHDWKPLELRPPPSPPIEVEDPDWSAMTREIRDHAEAEKIPFAEPRRVPWSRKAHELALHAAEKGCFDPVHQALFQAHFEAGLDIGRVDVLAGIAAEAGLDRAEARTVLGVDRFRPQLEASRRRLLAKGFHGVPTLQVAGQRLEGFRSPGTLRSFLTSELQGGSDAASVGGSARTGRRRRS